MKNQEILELCNPSGGTPQGLFWCKCLIFRAKNPFEDFQKIVETTIPYDIDCMFNISDDVAAHATNPNKPMQQLWKVFDKIRAKGMKLNFKKCEFGKSSINYMRHILSSEWLFPESEKVNLIFHLKRPSNTSEVCSCLGLVTYCSKFIPNFTAITEPLRWLPHQKVCFIWNGELKSTLSKIKTFFSKAPVLLYFHLAFKTRIVADTSKQGLGAVLLQKNPANSFF